MQKRNGLRSSKPFLCVVLMMVTCIGGNKLSADVAFYVYQISHTPFTVFGRVFVKATIGTVRILLLFLVLLLVLQPSLINILISVGATINCAGSIRIQVMLVFGRFCCIAPPPLLPARSCRCSSRCSECIHGGYNPVRWR